jgi:hypothetical protein
MPAKEFKIMITRMINKETMRKKTMNSKRTE